MKGCFILMLLGLTLAGCTGGKDKISVPGTNLRNKMIDFAMPDSLIVGRTYLSVYSEIYSQTEHRTSNLTATVSLRNTSVNDSIFILSAEYFDTEGKIIRNYLDKTIFLLPLETVEIVIDEVDYKGGTGGNFIFDWRMKEGSSEPLFEAVMISTYGQQGLSFTSQGVRTL